MDDISDPLGDRVMKSVPPLARFPLKKEEIWHNSGEYFNEQVRMPLQTTIAYPIIRHLLISSSSNCN